MRLMIYNTEHCFNEQTKQIDFPAIAAAIKGCKPDVVGLNEIRGKGPDPEYGPQTELLSELTEMPHAYFAKAIDVKDHGPYGNALLSKLPLASVETIPVPDPIERLPNGRWYETRCLLKATLENGLVVMVIHFGLNPDEQKNAVDTVLANLPTEKCVLMGDFNLRPDNPLLDPIRARMKDAADAFTAPKLSFPSHAPDRKIDYIFVTPDVEIVAADIPAVVVSDHRPHTVEIRIK